MSAAHKRLLRLAAEEVESNDSGLGMCYALLLAFKGEPATALSVFAYSDCRVLLMWMYRPDSPYSDRAFWMGPDFTEEQKAHRVMALLFAAECFDDMEGV